MLREATGMMPWPGQSPRRLSDDQLGKSATVLTGMPPMSAEQIVTRILINHIDEHFGSIRKTVGHPAEPS